ncbi:MAG: hypothetical protein K2X66_02645, partial [Cyanobacteria bacterium]|nr:hypothetical protein [Cyanobacteriota bacterium]
MIPVKTILSAPSPPVLKGPQLTRGIFFAGDGQKLLQDQFLRNTPAGNLYPGLPPPTNPLSFRGRQDTEATPGGETQHKQPLGAGSTEKIITNEPVGKEPVDNSAGIPRDPVEESIPEIDVLQELNKFYDIFSQAYQDKTQRAEAFSQFLWNQVISPAIAQNPEGLKVAIENWEQTILKEGKPGVIQQSTLALMGFFKNNLDKPEVLKETTRLFSILYFNGGYRKINRLIGLFSTNKFAKASPIEKGKLIVEDLGTLFIKLVQTLSTVPGLFTPEVQASFTPLYQDITPVPFPDIKKLVESELKMPLAEAYQSFEETPVNVGSIAQVHKATLHNGEVVAVKIEVLFLRPRLT